MNNHDSLDVVGAASSSLWPAAKNNLQTLVARYAASHLDELTGDPSFMAFFQRNGEFAKELVLAAKQRDALRANEVETL